MGQTGGPVPTLSCPQTTARLKDPCEIQLFLCYVFEKNRK